MKSEKLRLCNFLGQRFSSLLWTIGSMEISKYRLFIQQMKICSDKYNWLIKGGRLQYLNFDGFSQSLWRCYAASDGHPSIATWKIHLNRAQRSPSSVKTNTSILTRMSTIRRPKSNSRSPARDPNKNKMKMSNFSSDNLSHCEDALISSQRNSELSIATQKRNSDVNFLLDDEDEGVITTLTSRHKG